MSENPNENGVNEGGEPMDTAPPAVVIVPAAVQPGYATPSVVMPLLQQSDKVYVGPGAREAADVIGLGLTKISSRQREDLERAKRYAIEQSVQFVMRKQQQQHQQNQQKVAMYAQALSLMSRVYIGSISFDIREEHLKTVFAVFGPIKSVNMSWDGVTGHHKGFAFLEFEVPEAAQLAQDAMNGKMMGGRNLKVSPVGRPASMPQAQPIIDMIMQEAKSYNRVYVSSVHPDLTEQDLRSVFEAFGKILRCQLAKTAKGHRGFGYLEFDSAQAVKEAIDGLNNFDLGGQYLQVGRCVTPPEALTYLGFTTATASALPNAAAQAAAAVTAKIQAQEIAGLGKSAASAGVGECSPPSSSSAIGGSSSPSSSGVVKQAEGERVASPGASPRVGGNSDITSSPTGSSSPPLQPTTTSANGGQQQRGGGRRGFGGFASAVPPPAIVQSLPPPQLVSALPVSGVAGAAAPVALVDAPRVPPTLAATPLPSETKAPSTKKGPQPKKDILERIKIKPLPVVNTSERATFAPLPVLIAPKDRNAEDEQMGICEGGMLAIGGPGGSSSSSALAIRDPSGGALMKTKKDGKSNESASQNASRFKRKKAIKPAKVRLPNLSTPHAQAAAQKAGALNDQMQAANAANEEASLASQENFEIRGNEHRNALMHKLKAKLDRSSVIVLTNMVPADQVDDELEDEIRGECTKHGVVIDVVIVSDTASNEAKIFVRFADSGQAETARVALDQRFFDGRRIGAAFYDQTLFEHEDFTA